MKRVNNYFFYLFLLQLILICGSSDASELGKQEEPVREIEEQVNVFVGNIIRPVTYAGSGWLTGAFSNSQPHDSLLLPLKTQRIRSREAYIVSVYDKCKKLGISMEVVTNRHRDVWAKMALDGTDDMAPYVERHEALVNRMLERGMGGLSYSIFQESNDERHLGWNEQNEPYYLEAYRLAYNAIKNTDSTALVVGPNAQWAPYSWWWKDHEGDYTWFIRNFIDYCLENQCMPDVIAWRSWDCEGFDIATAAEEIRNHLKEKGIPPIPLEQDDLGCKARQFSPGSYVSYLANIERAEITYTCKCCWDGDCFTNTLQGLLTKENRQPRSLWWMYKSYGDLTGQIVEVAPSNTVDGVVAIDNNEDIIRAVIGRFRESSGPVLIRFQGVEDQFSSAKVVAERIKNTEDKSLKNPEKTIEQSFQIKNGQLEIILDDLGSFDAYSLTVKLVE